VAIKFICAINGPSPGGNRGGANEGEGTYEILLSLTDELLGVGAGDGVRRFTKTSRVTVMLEQGLHPRGYDPMANSIPEAEVRSTLQRMRALIGRGVHVLPSLAKFLTRATQLRWRLAVHDSPREILTW
jgi:hypothetical protein